MGRRKLVLDEEEEGRIKMNGKNKGKKKEEPVLVDSDEEEEEDGNEADLDEYENDGFIVDDEEEDGGSEEKQKKKKKKKKKRKSFKNIVLDDDDLELLEENKFYGFNQGKMGDGKFKRLKKASEVTELPEHFSDNEESLFNDIAEDEYKSDAEEDDMADFIVDEDEIYGKGGPVRRELNQVKNSSYLRKESRRGFANANELPEQPTEVLAESKKLDESTQFDSLIQINAFLGEKGHYIEDTDIPERMQIFEESVGPAPVDNMSLEEESSWILNQLAENLYPLFSEKIDKEDPNFLRPLNRINKEDIVRFLELHRLKKYDIPFISTYRKEQCLSLLEDPEQNEAENIYKDDAEGTPKLKCHKVLWAIKELDRKWLLLQKRKSALLMYFNKRFAEESQSSFCDPKASVNKQIFKSITKALEKAESEREIDDANMKFNLHFPPAEELGDSMYKRHVKKSHYNICTEAGLRLLVDKFGNPEQFGLQVTLENLGMEFHEDPNESPENIASEFMSDRFETSEDVLKGARHMAAVEISSEASFRKHVRNIFMDKALVSTSPTLEGDIVIDSFHQYSGVKWLREKPLLKFEDAQWLLIQKAEEEKLLQVIVKLPDSTLNELKSVCADVYLRAEGRSSQLWNEQRKLILHDAISNFLLPSMEKEARELLTTKAKNWLLMEYGKQLWNRVSVAPYQCNGNVSKENGFTQRVMACCWGPGKPATTFVMLDSSGKLLDVLHAGSLTLWLRNMNDQQRKKSDQQRILRFLSNYQPKVIVLGAANVMCTRLKDDINEIISMMVEENLPDVSQQMNKVRVVFGDECLPNIYEHSQVSSDQLPRQPDIVKRAVALGRFLQNPLAMVATLCGVQKEILSWQLSPLQQFLTSDEKFEMIEWVMVDVTNQVGVDVSKAVSHDWLFAPLQFVSGLGPRKAALLHKESLGDIAVRNRRELTAYGLKTEKIFYNAVGFLRVCFNDPFSTDSDTDVLDGTRIHPESYAVAKELAEAVYRYNHKENANIDVSLVNAIGYIQENPILLQSFDINAYADTLQIEKGEYGRETIYDIKNELVHGFIDPRRPYVEPTQDEEFDMISGKTGDAPLEGKRVEAIVRHVQSQRAFCVLGSGLTGILLKDDFSDEIDDISLSDKMHQGDKLACKIKEIEKNRYRVTLTCKASELKSGEQVHFHKLDPYYQKGQVILPSQPEKSYKDELANNHFKPRIISHPCFWNITAYQANEFLADKDIGEYIFHPSSRGPCYLTFTLKISDGLSVQKDIVEIGKDMLDMASLLRLGKTLKLGDERFEDIDEVMRNYINPLVVHLKTMLNFQKFKKGSKSEVDESLKAEKAEYPMRIAYGFGISYEHPGTFILSYIRSTNPHHEFVGIHPKGFKFRKQMFEKIEHMVSYFQKHINDPIVPPRDSRIGGSIGTSMAGDWRSNKVDQQGQSHSGKNDGEDGWGQRRGRGRGRGQGRAPDCGTSDEGGYNGSYQNKDDSYITGSKWGDSKDGNMDDANAGGGRSNNRGVEFQNSTSGWGSDGAHASGGTWGSGVSDDHARGGSGSGTDGFGQWGSNRGGFHASGSNQDASNDLGQGGVRRGRGREHGWGRGCGRDSYTKGGENFEMGCNDTPISGWRGVQNDSADGGSWGNANSGGLGGFHASGSNQDFSNDLGQGGGRGRGRGWGQGRGRGRGRENGRGRGSDSYTKGGENFEMGCNDTPTGGWRGAQNDSVDGGSWGNANSGGSWDNTNSGGWGENRGGRSFGGGNWGTSRGSEGGSNRRPGGGDDFESKHGRGRGARHSSNYDIQSDSNNRSATGGSWGEVGRGSATGGSWGGYGEAGNSSWSTWGGKSVAKCGNGNDSTGIGGWGLEGGSSRSQSGWDPVGSDTGNPANTAISETENCGWGAPPTKTSNLPSTGNGWGGNSGSGW